MQQLDVFEAAANRLAVVLPRVLADIRRKNGRGATGAAVMFKAMGDAVDGQTVKLDQLQRQYIEPVWGRLNNVQINRVRRIVDDVKAEIERAAEEA